MLDARRFAFPSRTGWALLAALIAGCASGRRPPLPLSDEYGTVSAPDAKQAVVIDLKNGSEFEIRKLQEEDDTLFAVLLDYSFRKVPKDSVKTVRNIPRDSLAGSKSAWTGRQGRDHYAERSRGRSDIFANFGLLFALGALLVFLFLNS
jgi:hypothetical protein